MRCPFCGANALRVRGDAVHPGRPDLADKLYWACSRRPGCDAYVGCRPGTDDPLGPLADPALREWRAKAQAAVDLLWGPGGLTRDAAYRWLRATMRLAKGECRVGLLDASQCKNVVRLCTNKGVKS